jgi:RimJ/RimL family protein N-acetyltransferase
VRGRQRYKPFVNDEPQFVDFKCPYCREIVSFPEDVGGTAKECPNCLESLIVPTEPKEFANAVPVPIHTPRLILRRLQTTDYKDLAEFVFDREAYPYISREPPDEQGLLKWLEADRHVKLTSPDTAFTLAIELQSETKVIGLMYLHINEARNETTLQVSVSRKYQRQGLATEAADAILGFCFNAIGLHRVVAHADSRNIAARRVCEKLGMRQEAEFFKDTWLDGEWVNSVWYGILAEEYRAARSKPPQQSA